MLSLPFICSFELGSLQLGATQNPLPPPQNLPQPPGAPPCCPTTSTQVKAPVDAFKQKPWLEQGLQQAQLCPAGSSTLRQGLSTENDHLKAQKRA